MFPPRCTKGVFDNVRQQLRIISYLHLDGFPRGTCQYEIITHVGVVHYTRYLSKEALFVCGFFAIFCPFLDCPRAVIRNPGAKESFLPRRTISSQEGAIRQWSFGV